ncbi:hypothetical protein KIL84_018457, partial [Mauremys mutica]
PGRTHFLPAVGAAREPPRLTRSGAEPLWIPSEPHGDPSSQRISPGLQGEHWCSHCLVDRHEERGSLGRAQYMRSAPEKNPRGTSPRRARGAKSGTRWSQNWSTVRHSADSDS